MQLLPHALPAEQTRQHSSAGRHAAVGIGRSLARAGVSSACEDSGTAIIASAVATTTLRRKHEERVMLQDRAEPRRPARHPKRDGVFWSTLTPLRRHAGTALYGQRPAIANQRLSWPSGIGAAALASVVRRPAHRWSIAADRRLDRKCIFNAFATNMHHGADLPCALAPSPFLFRPSALLRSPARREPRLRSPRAPRAPQHSPPPSSSRRRSRRAAKARTKRRNPHATRRPPTPMPETPATSVPEIHRTIPPTSRRASTR